MQNYKGYSISSLNDLKALGHGNNFGSVYIKDPNGRSIRINLSLEEANNLGDGSIYREAVRMIDNSLDSPEL